MHGAHWENAVAGILLLVAGDVRTPQIGVKLERGFSAIIRSFAAAAKNVNLFLRCPLVFAYRVVTSHVGQSSGKSVWVAQSRLLFKML